MHHRFFSPLPYWLQDRLPLPSKRAYHENLRKLQRVVEDAIETRRRAMASTPVDDEQPAEDFLGFLLQEQRRGTELSTEYIRNELITLLFAGHDTTTSTDSLCSTVVSATDRSG